MGRRPLPRRSVFYAEGPAAPGPEARSFGREPTAEVVRIDGSETPVQSVISSLRRGDELIVQRLEDLGHELADVLQTVEKLQRRGIRLKVLQDGLDSASRSMAHVLDGVRMAADFQRRVRREGWRRDIAAAREQGAFAGGRPKRLSLRDVAELRARGMGATEIARQLNVSRWSVYRTLKQLGAEGG